MNASPADGSGNPNSSMSLGHGGQSGQKHATLASEVVPMEGTKTDLVWPWHDADHLIGAFLFFFLFSA